MNEKWAREMIQELVHQGIKTFCIAPGSRSTPLTLAAAEHPDAETIVHYDERGLAFHALGIAKGGKGVALIVTSGSALGHLLPAVMEAHHDHIPLVLLTADRPPELRDTGANQTTDQVGFFHPFVRFQKDLPCPDPKIPEGVIGKMIAQGVASAMHAPKGPIHFNCMYRKPLAKASPSPFVMNEGPETVLSLGKLQIGDQEYGKLADTFGKYEKGIILISGTEERIDPEELYFLARTLQWPIFCDVLSEVRSDGEGYGLVSHYDFVLREVGSDPSFFPDAILQIGDRFVSKTLLDWIGAMKPNMHCHIASHPVCKDATHTITHRVATDAPSFVKKLPSFHASRPPSSWFDLWKSASRRVKEKVVSYFLEERFAEPHLFHLLKGVSAPAFFFASSMTIRNGDLFFFPEEKTGRVFGNRGLSGIDGAIATAAGIARGRREGIVAIMGDLTFLHDLNSLPLIKQLPVKIIVINNDGGDMFSFLPISKRKEVFDEYFTTPHHLSFEQGAALFDIPYSNPKTLKGAKTALNTPGCSIIELTTEQGVSKQIHKEVEGLNHFGYSLPQAIRID
ncbi:MAG: 2-succinyl-5-enolpyruvyl-6-hydroxy-3-cyclohexene-1-carboxylic-acid synthase [Simkania sp.]|nr:2-succinyl-5-enolpyruvyl-6-hydroxy-3-cyclohexene-1-carboxylic-acid synthase [Simkania sp.]